MAETTMTLITDDLRDAIALALAGRVNGLASDGLGWYRNEDQVEEFHAQADAALAAVDLPALRGRWVAEALDTIVLGLQDRADTEPRGRDARARVDTTVGIADLIRRLADEYRNGQR